MWMSVVCQPSPLSHLRDSRAGAAGRRTVLEPLRLRHCSMVVDAAWRAVLGRSNEAEGMHAQGRGMAIRRCQAVPEKHIESGQEV